MFSTRLNPTKPPAAHRAVLEHVGAACRELRPLEQACAARQCRNAEIVPILARHGVFRVGIAEEFGGVGTEPLLCAMTAERLGRDGFGPSSVFAAHSTQAAACLARWGNQAVKQDYLPRAASGQCPLGFLQYSPLATPSFEQTTAGYLLNGTGLRAVNVEAGGAMVVFAHHSAGAGPSAFLVDGDTPGLKVNPAADQAAIPSGGLVELILQNCELPSDRLLGTLGDGEQVAFTSLLNGRLAVAAATLGVLADSLEVMASAAAEFLSSNPAATNRQAIEQLVSVTATDLEASRALVYAAAELKVDYDRRPYWRHLQLETATLVNQARALAGKAVGHMFEQARQIVIDGRSLFESLPIRHRLLCRPTVLGTETEAELSASIAEYYLFQ